MISGVPLGVHFGSPGHLKCVKACFFCQLCFGMGPEGGPELYFASETVCFTRVFFRILRYVREWDQRCPQNVAKGLQNDTPWGGSRILFWTSLFLYVFSGFSLCSLCVLSVCSLCVLRFVWNVVPILTRFPFPCQDRFIFSVFWVFFSSVFSEVFRGVFFLISGAFGCRFGTHF